MASPTTNESARTQLTGERASLQKQLEDLEASVEGTMTFDENFADSGQVAAEQGEARALVASLSEQLREVDHALAKLDDGSYGKCEECGERIGEARLEAMPATRYCIKHA